MVYLLKVLSDMLQNPQLLLTFSICPKPKVKLGPTDLIYPAPPSSFDIATARNPRQFGHTDTDLGLTEMALHSHCVMFHYFGLTESVKSVTPRLLVILFVACCFTSVSLS